MAPWAGVMPLQVSSVAPALRSGLGLTLAWLTHLSWRRSWAPGPALENVRLRGHRDAGWILRIRPQMITHRAFFQGSGTWCHQPGACGGCVAGQVLEAPLPLLPAGTSSKASAPHLCPALALCVKALGPTLPRSPSLPSPSHPTVLPTSPHSSGSQG